MPTREVVLTKYDERVEALQYLLGVSDPTCRCLNITAFEARLKCLQCLTSGQRIQRLSSRARLHGDDILCLGVEIGRWSGEKFTFMLMCATFITLLSGDIVDNCRAMAPSLTKRHRLIVKMFSNRRSLIFLATFCNIKSHVLCRLLRVI